jgi:hypothetical protein
MFGNFRFTLDDHDFRVQPADFEFIPICTQHSAALTWGKQPKPSKDQDHGNECTLAPALYQRSNP